MKFLYMIIQIIIEFFDIIIINVNLSNIKNLNNYPLYIYINL